MKCYTRDCKSTAVCTVIFGDYLPYCDKCANEVVDYLATENVRTIRMTFDETKQRLESKGIFDMDFYLRNLK